jgi:hypothetical protein
MMFHVTQGSPNLRGNKSGDMVRQTVGWWIGVSTLFHVIGNYRSDTALEQSEDTHLHRTAFGILSGKACGLQVIRSLTGNVHDLNVHIATT